jgi:hypothetical protein
MGDIGLGFLDPCLLLNKRRGNAVEARTRFVEVSLGLEIRNPEIPIVDPCENLARFDRLVVAGEDLRDKAANLRRHDDFVRLQIGVVGRLLEAAIRPPMPTKTACYSDRKQEDKREQHLSAARSRQRCDTGCS